MGLKMMVLTSVSLVRNLLPHFICVVTMPLVVLGAWGLAFLYQQEPSPDVIFCLCCVRTNRSQIQRWLTHRKVLALKFLVLFTNLKLNSIAIIVVWLRRTHSYRCRFTENMIWRAPMGSIRRPLDPGSGSTDATAFTQWVYGREPYIHELWCMGLDIITLKVHPTAQVEFTSGTVIDFVTNYLA